MTLYKFVMLGDGGVIDTAGQEDYAAIRDQHILQGDAFVLVYSVTHKHSFQELPLLYEAIQNVKEEHYPIVVCGNKIDLEKTRTVSTQDGQQFAKKIGAPFYETSAKTRVNVEEAFYELVRETRKWMEKRNTQKNGKKKKEKEGKEKRCCLM